jgi:hypothetical protein
MTIENSIVVGLGDITQVVLECQCGARFSFNPDKHVNLPHNCHQCHAEWRDDWSKTFDQVIVEGFINNIRKAREQQQANSRIKLKLVFQDTASESSVPSE